MIQYMLQVIYTFFIGLVWCIRLILVRTKSGSAVIK